MGKRAKSADPTEPSELVRVKDDAAETREGPSDRASKFPPPKPRKRRSVSSKRRTAGAAIDEEDDGPTFRSYLDTVLAAWRVVLTVLLLGLLGGVAYYLLASPKYEVQGLVQVEDKEKGIAGLEDLTEIMTTQSLADTEIELIQSQFLLGTVIDELNMEITVKPHYFPLIGKAIARWRGKKAGTSSLFGLNRYAWGTERISVKTLEVPNDWIGEWLTVTAKGGNQYTLKAPDGEVVLDGTIGAPATGSGGPDLPVQLLVTDIVARPGTEFRIKRDDKLTAIEELKDRLTVTEKGKKTGVLEITLTGEHAEEVSRIVDTIESSYLRQNIARKSEEAQKTLEFVDSQLPDVKTKLETAEAALAEYQGKVGSVDISIEAKAALDMAAELEKQITLVQMQIVEAKQHYTADHPVIQALQEQVDRLEKQRGGLEKQFKSLPTTELESVRRQRDVKVYTDLYVLLLGKSQDMKILKSGTIGTVRIVDVALQPRKPISPKLALSLALGLGLGFVLGITAAFVKKSFEVGVEDPELVETEIGIPVFASVPHSDAEQRGKKRKNRDGTTPVLTLSSPGDLAIEALRSLRTSVRLGLAEAGSNVIAIEGPSPGIGKSFVAVNLAHILASSGSRVLLVDTDMRRGHLHAHFGTDRGEGLAEALASPAAKWSDFIRDSQSPNLKFLARGASPKNPAELIESDRYEELMAWASRTFDIVLLDTPPVLAVADAALAARVAGVNMMVLRSGQHPVREVLAAVKRLEQNHVRVNAVILNDVKARAGYSYTKYGYTYHYEYK